MPARRANPQRVKLHRSYSVSELALCCGVHKNTIRHWQAQGLEPVDSSRPTLFRGATIRAFLAKAKASRKCPCPPGTLYCLRCREPRKPALGMVDFVPITESGGNLRAICDTCETVMHRRARRADLGRIMPGCIVQITQGQIRLKGRASPSLNCDKERQN
jgi:hypothetical protein